MRQVVTPDAQAGGSSNGTAGKGQVSPYMIALDARLAGGAAGLLAASMVVVAVVTVVVVVDESKSSSSSESEESTRTLV